MNNTATVKMSRKEAIMEVCDFIIRMELYHFNSLSDETKQKLKSEYGSDFGKDVDTALGFGL